LNFLLRLERGVTCFKLKLRVMENSPRTDLPWTLIEIQQGELLCSASSQLPVPSQLLLHEQFSPASLAVPSRQSPAAMQGPLASLQ
jgi:hypothetical protein